MLGGVKLKVAFSTEKTCFAYINSKYSTKDEKAQCVQVLTKDKPILLWVIFQHGIPEGQIACNPIFSRLIGLQEGSDIFVSPYGDVKVLEELYIDTDSPDDQEILEHNAELLQYRILDQLRLVVANQKAVVWISVSLPIVFTPKQTGILVNHSRVVVKVDAFSSLHSYQSSSTEDSAVKTPDAKFKSIGLINNAMLQPYLNPLKKLVLRAIPIDNDCKKDLTHCYTVFVHEDLLDDKHKESTEILATMKHIPFIIKNDQNDDENINNNEKINDMCIEIIPINSVVFKSMCKEVFNINIPTVLIPKTLNTFVNIDNGSRVILTFINNKVNQPEQIEIITYTDQKESESDIVEKFKKYVTQSTNSGKKFLINDGILKPNAEICQGLIQIKLKSDSLKYTIINSESFKHCKVTAKCLMDTDFEYPKAAQPVLLPYSMKNFCRKMVPVELLIENILSHVYFEIHREASFKDVSEIKSNIIVTGVSGTGKTSLCQIVQKELTVYSHIVQCRPLKGRKDIVEVLSKVIIMCQERSPAVLICDDLDSLVDPSMEGASPQDIAYYERLAMSLKQILQTCSGVCVLMTALSIKNLHPTLREFNGKPLFTAHFNIPELEQEDRGQLFKHFLSGKFRQQFTIGEEDFRRLAIDTAGFGIRDITDYLNKKIFRAVKKKKANPEEPKPRLIEDVQNDSEKANAFDIWGPVGGMENVKQELVECIFWPIMYPVLFPSQSCGILLYGPPGTGKSHIGSCLARLSNMNFLSVKGPELLSKYIGQSEKAVRDIFDKADMKRPCILFFDEFDSLAPKRGHDSTGVTDRVVNQLLTRLDGAEGGARGPVIAATSRPDLLDPALLRPGRLQRHIYCALPDEADRFQVLKTLAKSVSIADDVDIKDLSQKTDGFSPADLKSLLVTAQLTRLESHLISGEGSTVQTVVVTKEDVDSALQETKPSLSLEQRVFYDMIYKRFRGETLMPEEMMMSMQMQKQRVTLA